MRKYSMIDLLRFRTFASENPEMKPMELIKGYNEKFPELTDAQKLHNVFLATGFDFASKEKRRDLEILKRKSGKPLWFVERVDTNQWWTPTDVSSERRKGSLDSWTFSPYQAFGFTSKEDAETRAEWISEEHGMKLEVTEHVFGDGKTKEAQ